MQQKNNHFEFHKYKQGYLRSITSKREGEMKMGFTLSNLENAKYVIIGVEESVGPRANNGRVGAENGFSAFLNYFLNMQANETLAGDEIHILGRVCPVDTDNTEELDLRILVAELDAFLLEVLKTNITENQIPIVIGGGHNNAFPLIKFSSERFNSPIQVVNLDAHADYRILEGRHSGNSFSYAFHTGILKKYHALGLHQRYNSQQTINDLRRDGHFFTFHEDYVFGNRNYHDEFILLNNLLTESDDYVGIELDLDTIERMPSSAYSPVGIPIELGRVYLNRLGNLKKVAYLHLPEGAPTNDLEDRIVGKALSYFVSDFIVANDS